MKVGKGFPTVEIKKSPSRRSPQYQVTCYCRSCSQLRITKIVNMVEVAPGVTVLPTFMCTECQCTLALEVSDQS